MFLIAVFLCAKFLRVRCWDIYFKPYVSSTYRVIEKAKIVVVKPWLNGDVILVLDSEPKSEIHLTFGCPKRFRKDDEVSFLCNGKVSVLWDAMYMKYYCLQKSKLDEAKLNCLGHKKERSVW